MSLKENSNGDIERQISIASDADNADGIVEPRQENSSPKQMYPNQFELTDKLRLKPYQVVAKRLPQEIEERLTITDKCLRQWKKDTGIVRVNLFQKYAYNPIINFETALTKKILL